MTAVLKFIGAVILAVLCCLSHAFPARAAENVTVQLNADVISFEEATGVATAEGSVRLTDREFYVTAPYLEYTSASGQVTALSSPSGEVVLFTAGKRLAGERLDYNLETRRGAMTNPSGKVDVFYVRGETIEVMPSSETPQRKGKTVSGSAGEESDDDLSAIWRGASVTTCGEPHPHYRLTAKNVTIFPGDKMILHRPRAYLGKTPVLISPFDITIPLRGKDSVRQKIFPKLGYDSDKGAGAGMAGSFNWSSGALDLELIGWIEGIFEMDALAIQRIGTDLSVYAGIRRAYDKDLDETDWRPRWGLSYERNGWNMTAGWTKRELLSVERRAGEVSRYVLERKPEVYITSPWFNDAASNGHFRVFGIWGDYRDQKWGGSSSYTRSGAGVQIRGEPGARRGFTPFYNATYTGFMYDDDVFDSQSVLDARVGFIWETGKFELKTAYLRQLVWGTSPLLWDDYEERDEIYQEISLRIPTRSEDYFWRLGARGAYDLIDEELAEMVYKVEYTQHCLVWEAIFRDDRRGSDDWIGLSLSIKELPSGGLRLFGNSDSDLFDPFEH
jgi:LPS-assembly protein